MNTEHDLELRLIDPLRNRFRVYGLTRCRTLFGEECLRIQWGRIGNRHLRERDELFCDDYALRRRRTQLLELRRRHGYCPIPAPESAATASEPSAPAPQPFPLLSPTPRNALALERELVEAHGLSLVDRAVQQLVERWREATTALLHYLEERRPEHLDLVDVSTLAAIYLDAAPSTERALERELVEAHGLSLVDRAVQQLVERWREATTALLHYLEERRPEHLDLVDVSTLAAMYLHAAAP
jgi:predicted DNA-binding WGR domain protein